MNHDGQATLDNHARPLVVGIGSPHGDDQAGWLLIERLAKEVDQAYLRKASVPHNLIDWTDGCDALHIVDACDSGRHVMRIELSDETHLDQIDKLMHGHSSHHFGISQVIELGRLLEKLPRRIVVWAIPGESFGPGQTVSDLCQQQIDRCADLLSAELVHA